MIIQSVSFCFVICYSAVNNVIQPYCFIATRCTKIQKCILMMMIIII